MSQTTTEQTTKYFGRVKLFDRQKGFGFIVRQNTTTSATATTGSTETTDIFVHRSDLVSDQANKFLYTGEYVEYSEFTDPTTSKVKAVNVSGLYGNKLQMEVLHMPVMRTFNGHYGKGKGKGYHHD